MNQAVIRKALVEKGLPSFLIEFGWIGGKGPGIHITDPTLYALLPLGDELDLEFADFIYKEWLHAKLEKCTNEGIVEGIEA